MNVKNDTLLDIKYNDSVIAPKVTIITAVGTLDANAFHKLSDVIDKLLKMGRVYLIIDMSSIRFISSSAVGMLMGHKRRLVEHNGDLFIVGVSGDIKDKLGLMGATKVLDFYTDIKSAVGRFNWEYEKKEDVVNIVIPTELAYVPVVRRFIYRVAATKGFNGKDCFRIETIVDEICNNAIEHGISDKESGTIKIVFKISVDKVDLSVVNKTDEKKTSEIENAIESVKAGQDLANGARGRGLALVSKLADEIKVDVTDIGTNVHVVKLKEG